MDKQLDTRAISDEIEQLAYDIARVKALQEIIVQINDNGHVPAEQCSKFDALATASASILHDVGMRLDELVLILYRASKQSTETA